MRALDLEAFGVMRLSSLEGLRKRASLSLISAALVFRQDRTTCTYKDLIPQIYIVSLNCESYIS